MKKLAGFKLSDKVLQMIDELCEQTGKNKSQIIEEAVKLLYEQKHITEKEIELLERQNFQLQQILNGFNIALKSKDEVIASKDKIIKEKDKLIEEKDKLIEEKERLIKELLKKNKSFWQRWFG